MTEARVRDGSGFGPGKALQWTLGLWLVLALVVAAAALPLTVFPASVAIPREADAVIVLARGGGEQLDAARRLMNRVTGPPADLLLIANGDSVVWTDGQAQCEVEAEEYAVACFAPEPDTAIEEARAIAALVDERGWDNIAIVTTTAQATRSRRLVERCVGGAAVVQLVTAQPEGEITERVAQSVRGLAALVRDAVGDTSC